MAVGKKKRGYARRLASPKWQRKRLKLLKEAGWRCVWCMRGSEELQAHHGYYAKGKDGKPRAPEEYPDETIWVLCDSCHERAEKAKTAVHYEVAKIHPAYHWHLRRILKEIQGVIAEDPEALKHVGAVGIAPVDAAPTGHSNAPESRQLSPTPAKVSWKC